MLMHFNSIRLRFRNCAGKAMVVQRTYQLTQMKTAMRFKAMDGVIRVVNDLGEKVSMSHKCGELDRHIPEVLGVSKAILESVIFCHQEESNWPLQEGAELKKRFDAIFESARYTKALEAIRKLRKARLADTKDFKRDLDVLNVKMKAADAIQDKIDAAEEKLAAMLEEVEQATDSVEQAEETLTELEQLKAEIRNQQTALDLAQAEVHQKDDMVSRAMANIEQMMSDSDDELESLLNNYDRIIGDQQKAIDELKDQESQLSEQQKSAEAKHSKLMEAKGGLETKIEVKETMVTELVHMATKFGSKYNFHTQPVSSQGDEIQSFLAKFTSIVQDKEKAAKEVEATSQRAEDALNMEVSDLKAKLHHLKEELKKKQRELSVTNEEKRANATRLKQLSGLAVPSERDVAEMERVIQETEKSLQAFKDQHGSFALKAEIDALTRSVHDTTFDIGQLNQKIKVLRIHERDHVGFDSKREEYQRKKDTLAAKLVEKTTEHHGVLSGSGLANDIDELPEMLQFIDDLVAERKKASESKKKELALAETKLQEDTVLSKHIEKDLAPLRLEKNELERSQVGTVKKIMEELLPNEELKHAEKGLAKLEKTYFDAKDKALRCRSTITFLNILKKKGEVEKCCPLCVRGMNEAELAVFQSAIDARTDSNKLAEKIVKAEGLEKIAHDKWKAMEQCMPSWCKWMQLETQILEKSNELDAIYTTQRALQADVKDKKPPCEAAVRLFEDAQKAQREFAVLGEAGEELKPMLSHMKSEQERLSLATAESLGSGAPSMTEVQAALDEKQAQLAEQNRQLGIKQTALQRNQEIQQQMQNDLHKKRQDKLNMDQQRKDYDAAIEEQTKLRDREKVVRDAIMELTDNEPMLERDVRAKLEEREARRTETNAKKNKLRTELQQHQGDLRTFSDKVSHVQESMKQNLEQQLQRLMQQLAQMKQQQSTAIQALKELTPQITTVLTNLHHQETMKRHIRDNLEYRSLKKQLEYARGEVDILRQKLHALPSAEEVGRRVRVAETAAKAARDSRSMLKGRKQQLDDQIRDYKVQLRQSEFRNIEDKYRKKLIEFETTTMAVADLEKYYRALDQALIEYHSKKIEEINTIIRSLWQITYKGQDIDSIEIVSGPENSGTGAAASTAKTTSRSYDYRVMMKKGGAKIDMRGRCSAGQKVLAALVIRLALAETFCLNCGILALDEPTTNLDTENKYGLAQAITEYVVHSDDGDLTTW